MSHLTVSHEPIIIVSDDSVQLKIITTLIDKQMGLLSKQINHQDIKRDNKLKNAQLIIIDERSLDKNNLALSIWVRENHAHLKIILIGGLRHQTLLSQATKSGTADEYLLLPLTPDKLASVIKKCLYKESSKTTFNEKSSFKSTSSSLLSPFYNSDNIPPPKIKEDSMLARLNKRYPGIVDGKWQNSDHFK